MIDPVQVGSFFQVSLGDIAVIVAILGGIYRAQKWFMGLQRWMDMHQVEHDIVLTDYCDRKGIDINSLPTRTFSQRK